MGSTEHIGHSFDSLVSTISKFIYFVRLCYSALLIISISISNTYYTINALLVYFVTGYTWPFRNSGNVGKHKAVEMKSLAVGIWSQNN